MAQLPCMIKEAPRSDLTSTATIRLALADAVGANKLALRLKTISGLKPREWI